MSASFVDVYKLNYDDPSFRKDFGGSILGRDHGRAQLTFSYDLFFSFIKENSSIDINDFKKKDMKEIARLATLFGLDEKTMSYIVIDEYAVNDPIHLNFEKIRNKCENEIRFSQVKNIQKSNVSGDSELADKIRMMEEVAPAKFLQYLQQGTKPARSDLAIVNALSEDYGFGNGIINAIVDYVLTKNNNVLSKNYALKTITVLILLEGCAVTLAILILALEFRAVGKANHAKRITHSP